MQKIVKLCKLWGVFLPSLIFIFLSGRWLGFAVGAMNPVAAAQFYQSTALQGEKLVSAANPFEDFVFENKNTQSVQAPAERYNPAYNVAEEFMQSTVSDIVIKKDACYVKNMTHHTTDWLQQRMLAEMPFKVEKNSSRPQILIYHTHATEGYMPTADMAYDAAYSWRTTDTSNNMVAVGKVMADTLNSLGYNTIQDTTLHDYPSYNGSYDLSRQTVSAYLKKYPSIKIVLDVHRDAIERNGTIINPVTTINGKKCAQVMIISGCDSGYMNMPHYPENLKFATNLQNRLAKSAPGLMRPILFDYRHYNQDLSTGSLLIEVGGHGSTIQQAKNSAVIFATTLADMLNKHK